jgi:hypothetical protein
VTLRRVSQSSIEVLATAQNLVKPRPLTTLGLELTNPLTIANDWSIDVELSTSWRTDITRAGGDLVDAEESIGMLTRPTRRLTCRITGRNREETHALAQIMLSYALNGGPAPLYQDNTTITSASAQDANLRVSGDFSFGHFYPGQRVVILSPDPIRSRYENKAQWSTILESANDYLLLEGIPVRMPVPGVDMIVPCMDADLVASSSGTFITDDILRATLVWNETAGPETLPATFPPQAFNNLDAIVSFSAEGLPILDIPPDWSNGIDVRVDRRLSQQPLGRSTVTKPTGLPFFAFGLNFLAPNRRKAWDVLRVFDACRGRVGKFLFLHPNRAWRFFASPFSSLTACNIQIVGQRYDVATHFRKAAFVDANGQAFVRDISSVDNISNAFFRLNLATALPHTNFVAVLPIHECRLASDTLTQNWLTNTVAQTSLELEEIKNDVNVAVIGGSAALRFDLNRNHSKLSLSNPDIWLQPSTNSYQLNTTTGVLTATQPDPLRPIRVHRVHDVRETVPPQLSALLESERPFLWARQTPGTMTRFVPVLKNYGKLSVVGCTYSLSCLEAPTSGLFPPPAPLVKQHLWSNTAGWTLFLGATPWGRSTSPMWSTGPSPGVAGYATGEILRIVGDGNDIVRLMSDNTSGDQFRVRITGGGIATINNFNQRHFKDGWQKAYFVVLRFDAALGRLYVHLDGLNMAPGPGYLNVPSIQIPVNYECYIGGVFNSPLATGVFGRALANTWTAAGAVNVFASWKRALTPVEVNDIGEELSASYGCRWFTATYP